MYPAAEIALRHGWNLEGINVYNIEGINVYTKLLNTKIKMFIFVSPGGAHVIQLFQLVAMKF